MIPQKRLEAIIEDYLTHLSEETLSVEKLSAHIVSENFKIAEKEDANPTVVLAALDIVEQYLMDNGKAGQLCIEKTGKDLYFAHYPPGAPSGYKYVSQREHVLADCFVQMAKKVAR